MVEPLDCLEVPLKYIRGGGRSNYHSFIQSYHDSQVAPPRYQTELPRACGFSGRSIREAVSRGYARWWGRSALARARGNGIVSVRSMATARRPNGNDEREGSEDDRSLRSGGQGDPRPFHRSGGCGHGGAGVRDRVRIQPDRTGCGGFRNEGGARGERSGGTQGGCREGPRPVERAACGEGA